MLQDTAGKKVLMGSRKCQFCGGNSSLSGNGRNCVYERNCASCHHRRRANDNDNVVGRLLGTLRTRDDEEEVDDYYDQAVLDRKLLEVVGREECVDAEKDYQFRSGFFVRSGATPFAVPED